MTSQNIRCKNVIFLLLCSYGFISRIPCPANVPTGQSAVSERHPRLTQSQVLATAVRSYRQDERKRKPLPGKKNQTAVTVVNKQEALVDVTTAETFIYSFSSCSI